MIDINNIFTFSSPGPRENQEDCFLPVEPAKDSRIFVLCDGMGGHGHGEVASSVVANAIYSCLEALYEYEISELDIQNAVDCALMALKEADVFNDEERKMGTTLVVAVLNHSHILIGHIGDSRAYLFGADGLKKFRTIDHSRVEEAVQNEILTEEEAFTSPYRNIITRSIMADKESVKMDFDKIVPADGDILMLCSDGLTDVLRDREIESVLLAFPFSEAWAKVMELCMAAPKDNTTVVAVSLACRAMEPPEDINDEDLNIKSFTWEEIYSEHESELDEQTDSKLCPSCSTQNNADANFCYVCGTSFSENNNNEEYIDKGLFNFKKIARNITAPLKKLLKRNN